MREKKAMSNITSEGMITTTQALVPTIQERREELDATRHLPTALAEKMTRAGLFQRHACKELGGSE